MKLCFSRPVVLVSASGGFVPLEVLAADAGVVLAAPGARGRQVPAGKLVRRVVVPPCVPRRILYPAMKME